MVKLDRCVESCNTINDSSNKVRVPSKTEDLNLSMYNMITGTNESKTLTKHISWKSKCKLDWTKCCSNHGGVTTTNVDMSVKNIIYVKKNVLRIPVHAFVKMENI